MRKTKLLAVAAGFLAAAGLTTAGNIYVGGTSVGHFNGSVTVTGSGDVRLPSNSTIDKTINSSSSGDEPLQCGTNEVESNGECVCKSGYHRDFSGNCVTDDDGGTDDGGTDDGGTDDGGDVPSECPSGVSQAGSRDSNWTSIASWPPSDPTEKFTVNNEEFLAIKFTAPSVSTAGYLATATASHALNGKHAISISRCPGDFGQDGPGNHALGDGVCRKVSSSHTFWWSTMGKHADVACELEPGTPYYLNIKYARLKSLSTTTCDSHKGYCGALLQWVK